jgi:hypothetical protein
LEEIEEKGSSELIQKYTLKSHHYLSSSPHLAILAEEATLIVDYKGAIVQRIDFKAISCCNWG